MNVATTLDTRGVAVAAGPARSDALIQAQGIVKIYPTVSGEPVLALDHLDMAVRDGEFVCLVGPSGCGKSTLLRLLAGLDRADAGTFTLADRRIDGPSAEVGVVFQQATLLPWLTVWQNVTVPLRVGGHASPTAKTRCAIFFASPGLSVSRTNILTNCPAACSSAPPSFARSRAIPSFC